MCEGPSGPQVSRGIRPGRAVASVRSGIPPPGGPAVPRCAVVAGHAADPRRCGRSARPGRGAVRPTWCGTAPVVSRARPGHD